MAELSTIARPYAEALYAAARSTPQADAPATWLAALEQLAGVTHHPQVAAVVTDPKLTPQEIFDLISGVAGGQPPAGIANFLKLAIENGRLAVLPEVAVQFRALKNAAEGVADCHIETAFPLAEGQVADLLARLAAKFHVQLKPQVTVDRSLIGGVRVTVGDQVLDGSVRARLDAMRTALTA
jgi:F-type H+-transporting ATPase subunit delta